MTGTAQQRAAGQAVLTGLTAALRTADRPAFDRLVSGRDPAFTGVGDRIFAVAGLPTISLGWVLAAPQRQLPPARRSLLGSTAWVQQSTVRWQLRGDRHPAEHTLWLTFVRDGDGTRLAGTTDGPPGVGAQPLWLVDRVHALQQGRVTVVAAERTSATLWARRADAATVAVARQLHGELAPGPGAGRRWNGDLVVEVPADRADFERVLGVAAGSYSTIAAVAWPEGPEAATAALRIVVNPDQADRLDEDGADVLLTHEATHVATRSVSSPAPTWLVEGFADYVAYAAFPATADLAAAPVRAEVRRGGPAALPSDSAFAPDAGDLERSYAEAWLACRFLAGTSAPERLDRFYLRVDAGEPVDRAMPAVFGLTSAQFLPRWRRYLRDTPGPG